MAETATKRSSVYLEGDSCGILVTLPPSTVMHMLREAIDLAGQVDALDVVFAPLPVRSGDTAYIRPRAVNAILPGWPDDWPDGDD